MEQPHTPKGGQLHEHRYGPEPDEAWTPHDEMPSQGPWIYVVDQRDWDNGIDHGAWVPAGIGAHTLLEGLGRVLGRTVTLDRLSVIDQVGLDPMVDEDHFATEASR